MDRVWGYEAAFDTGTVTVHVRRLREKIEADPSRPATSRRSGASATGSSRDRLRPPRRRGDVGRGARAGRCSFVGCRSLSWQLAGLVCLALVLPLARGALSRRGDVRVRRRPRRSLASRSRAPSRSPSGRCWCARGMLRRVERLACAARALAAGDLSAPRSGRRARRSSHVSASPSTRWRPRSRSSSTPGVSWSPAPATTCAPRSPRCRR